MASQQQRNAVASPARKRKAAIGEGIFDICDQCGEEFFYQWRGAHREFCDACCDSRRRESNRKHYLMKNRSTTPYEHNTERGGATAAKPGPHKKTNSYGALIANHAASMKPGDVLVPINLQRMTPDQIIKAFEQGRI